MSAEFDAEAHVRHMAEVMGLPIREDWVAEVVANITATRAAAKFVKSFPLDLTDETAPVFRP